MPWGVVRILLVPSASFQACCGRVRREDVTRDEGMWWMRERERERGRGRMRMKR
jgi:hypothetical protein